ncbi:MAG: AMP-binding protein [Sphingomonas sp.]|uniref:AMP-binding protein n=1 Tax=Sphingomonas sp. TaxID=28214 RepID=UPI003F812622
MNLATKGYDPATADGSLMPIGDLLAHHARRDPGRPAITFAGRTVSYAELDENSNRRARQLAALGVEEGDVVTLAIPNGFEFYETVFAVWKLGAIPNNVSPKLPAAELQAIIELARPRLLVAPKNVGAGSHAFLVTGTPPGDHLSAEPLPTKVSPRWKIATSGGSTGRPKLILDKRPALWGPTDTSLGLLPGDTMLNPGPLYHNAPFAMSCSNLFTGGHVVEMGRFDAASALELIERHRIQWVNFVPTMMHRIWRLPAEQREALDLSSLRVVFHMAAPCPPWLKEAWIGWLGADRIFELYGGTEGQGFTVITGGEWLEHRGSVGRVLDGARLRVLDNDGEDCAPGEVGEIYLLPDGGQNSTYEYIGATAKAHGRWESLGDLGYLDVDGYLYLVDRRTDLILAGGANIYPAEVEAALDEHPGVLSSIVIGLPDADLGQRVHAIVQLTEAAGDQVDDQVLSDFLSSKLARYKLPRSFEFVSENLRDDAGKARRSKLREERLDRNTEPTA